jgi:hypothetical protein
VVAGPLPSEQLRPLAAGGLHRHDAADSLPFVVGPLHKAIDERSQKASGAKLKDRFRKGHDSIQRSSVSVATLAKAWKTRP